MAKLSATRLKKIENTLLAQRKEYLKRTSAIRKDIGQGMDPDSSERVVELENSMVLDELDREAKEELQKIEVALNLIDAGGYGICSVCEDEIDFERLSAYPLAVHCLSCAEDEEKYTKLHG